MATIALMKKGGKTEGIHIKKSHEGRFSNWCKRHGYSGPNAACDAAGKRSDSASVRKQATFSSNAKKWNR